MLHNIWRSAVLVHLRQHVVRFHRNSHFAALRTSFEKPVSCSVELSLNLSHPCRTYSTRPPDTLNPKTLAQYLEILRADNAKMRRVNSSTLSSALDQARFSPVGKYSQEDALFLLQCCSMMPEKPRPEKLALIELAWPLVVRDQQPTSLQLVKLLREYRTNGKKLNYVEFMEKNAEVIDIALFESLLYLAAENGSADGMVQVLSAIKAKDLPLTENVFNALILGHSRCRNLDNSEQVLHTMSAANIVPSSRTYKEMIRAYIENTSPDKAESLLKAKGKLLSELQVFSIIRTAIRRDDQSRVLEMSFKLLSEEILCNRHIIPEIRNACVELIRANEARKAFRIIEQLHIPKFSDHEDSDSFATFFISELIRSGTPLEDVIEMARKLRDSGRNTRALHVCCEVALRHDSENALSYLKELATIEELRPHYFWPLFLRDFKTNGESGVLQVVKEMYDLKVTPDYETVVNYMLAKIPITLSNVRNGIKELEDRGAKMAHLMPPLVSHLIYQNRLRDAQDLVETYSTKIKSQVLIWPIITFVKNVRSNFQSEFAPLAKLLKAIAEKCPSDSDIAGQLLLELIAIPSRKFSYEVMSALLQQFRSHSVSVSKVSGDVLAQYVAKCNDEPVRSQLNGLLDAICDGRLNAYTTDHFDEHIRHPRDMSLDELECHLVELQAKNANERGVLRRLLQLNVRAGKIDRALEVHKQCQAKGVAYSPGMLASILDLMVRTKDVSGAFAAIDQMHKMFPQFLIDEHKIIDLAALLVEKHQLNEAKKLLKTRSVTHDVRGGPNVQKNIWNLLTNVANLSNDPQRPPLVKEFFKFLIDLGYCEPQNNLLGPIIRERLVKGQLKEAFAEFMSIVEEHKRTPLQFELFCNLISATNSEDPLHQLTQTEAKEMLQMAVSTCTKIHGPVNTNVSLAIAFAKAGSERQLRKILIDPAVQVNMEAILKQCEYLCGNGVIEPLMRLAKCSRGLQGGVSEQDFYNMVLAQHVRQNDYMAALNLFEQIVADDEFKLTGEFTKTLIGLLQKNNLEVPSSVQMYARS